MHLEQLLMSPWQGQMNMIGHGMLYGMLGSHLMKMVGLRISIPIFNVQYDNEPNMVWGISLKE